MTAVPLRETEDHWLLPLVGRQVTQCCLDYALTIRLADPEASFDLRIGEAFVLCTASGEELTIEPEGNPVQVAPAFSVLRQAVVHALAYKDGRLEVAFSDGSSIRVPVGHEYEAWELVGPGWLRVVSLPGGELAVWSPESSQQE